MRATVKWLEKSKFTGESGSGHRVVMDGPPDYGGENAGVRPMEMLLLGLGGCASFDVMAILKKSRQVVHSCRVEIDATRADAVPAVFTKIHLTFLFEGEQLKQAQVARAVALSAEKYCSASIMLEAAGVELSHSYQIVS